MNAAIDYEKSIRHKRLIYLGTSKKRMRLSLLAQVQGIFLLVISMLFFLFVLTHGSQFAAALSMLPMLLILISMLLMNKLNRAEGTEVPRNQSEMFSLLLGIFPGIQRHNCSQHIIVITSAPKPFTLNKDIIVLLEDNYVYLNISTSGQGIIRYILFAIPNYFKSRYVLKHFSRRIKQPPFRLVHATID